MLKIWRERMAQLKLTPCAPPPWARGGHAQTIFGSYLPSTPLPPGSEPVRITLPDGDVLTGISYRGIHPLVVYLFHGLSGSTDATYMRIAANMAVKRGYHVVAINHRGCGSGVGLALGPYHSGRAEDLAEVIRWGRAQHPDKLHVAVGVSLSGNALLLLAAHERGKVAPDLAISVNAPINLQKSALAIKRGLAKLYDLRFSIRCRQAVTQRMAAGLKPGYHVPRFCSLHDFDNYYTAPAGGFRDREDYYQTCSAQQFLSRISVPTIALSSLDDPMVDYRDYQQTPRSEHVHLHLEKHGGHLGYLDNSYPNRRWLAYFLDQVIAASAEVLKVTGPA